MLSTIFTSAEIAYKQINSDVIENFELVKMADNNCGHKQKVLDNAPAYPISIFMPSKVFLINNRIQSII